MRLTRCAALAVVLLGIAACGGGSKIAAPSSTLSSVATPGTALEATTAVSTTNTPTTSVATTEPAATEAPTSAVDTIAPETTAPGSLLALDVLSTITVQNEYKGGGFDRTLFGYPNDADGNGCNTRADVLVRDSVTPAAVEAGCDVVSGTWLSSYDGVTLTDPAELEIDHVVALKEAFDSGAWTWDPSRMSAFANDLEDIRTLVAATASSNAAKGDRDPSNWIPSDTNDVCSYLADWTATKARWSLTMDRSEFGRIRNLFHDRCPSQTIAPWLALPPLLPIVAPTPPRQLRHR